MLGELLPNSFNIGLSLFVIMHSLVFQDDRVVVSLHQFLYDVLAYEFGGTLIS